MFWTTEMEALLAELYSTKLTAIQIAKVIEGRFGKLPTVCMVRLRANALGLKKKTQNPWTDEMLADMRALTHEGHKNRTIAWMLNQRYGTNLTDKSINYARGKIGLKTKFVNTWTPDAVELLHQYYGMYTVPSIAKIINHKMGTSFTRAAIERRARVERLSVRTAQGDLIVADAARELNVKVGLLHKYLSRHKVKTYGFGAFRYIPHEEFKRVQMAFNEQYSEPPEPTMGTTEVARKLHYDVDYVRVLIMQGKLRGYRYGRFWLVSEQSVKEFQRTRALALVG